MGTEPDIAAGSEINADNTAITIFLREGLKWSDGHPWRPRTSASRTSGREGLRKCGHYTACNPNHTTLMAA